MTARAARVSERQVSGAVRYGGVDGTLDLLKCIAFGLMMLDHINHGVLADRYPWMFAVGRLAFPIFAAVFAYHLANHLTHGRRFALRALGFGLLAQVPFAHLYPGGLVGGRCLNILFVFFFAWLINRLWARGTGGVVAATVLFVLASLMTTSASYSWAGLGLILALTGWFRRGRWPFLALTALCVFALAPEAYWLLPTIVGLGLIVRVASREIRLKRFLPANALYLAYPASLWALVVIA